MSSYAFYKDGDLWKYMNGKSDVIYVAPPGNYRLAINSLKLGISGKDNLFNLFRTDGTGVLATAVLKSATPGDYYASVAAFVTANSDFFNNGESIAAIEDVETSVDELKVINNQIAGQDFLCITDTSAHASLDCTMIYVMADAVFTAITVAGSSVAAKGLTAITVVAGTMLPFGKVHATSIELASGIVIAYIN